VSSVQLYSTGEASCHGSQRRWPRRCCTRPGRPRRGGSRLNSRGPHRSGKGLAPSRCPLRVWPGQARRQGMPRAVEGLSEDSWDSSSARSSVLHPPWPDRNDGRLPNGTDCFRSLEKSLAGGYSTGGLPVNHKIRPLQPDDADSAFRLAGWALAGSGSSRMCRKGLSPAWLPTGPQAWNAA
jgi:hypothetical protein